MMDKEESNEQEMQQAREQEAKIRSLMRTLLEPAAYDRLVNIRLSNINLYLQVVSQIFNLYRLGKLRGKVTEEQLKSIAASLLSNKDPSIKRLSK